MDGGCGGTLFSAAECLYPDASAEYAADPDKVLLYSSLIWLLAQSARQPMYGPMKGSGPVLFAKGSRVR